VDLAVAFSPASIDHFVGSCSNLSMAPANRSVLYALAVKPA
jgi:hypothetical protein